jgi:hypothetical protein
MPRQSQFNKRQHGCPYHIPIIYHVNLPHSAFNSTCPSSPTTFPRSHSLACPLFDHVTSSSSLLSPFSHFLTCASVNPAAFNRSAPCCFQRCRSRNDSRASPQSSSASEACRTSVEGSYVEEKRESMPVELALLAPRPRERMEG